MPVNVCGILLAAGSSTRFNGQKLLHPLSNGDPVGVASARHLKHVVRNSVAVVANDDDKLARLLKLEGYSLIINSNNSGIGSSIARGVGQTKADAWIITLADMPYIRCETIHQIAHLLHAGNRIVAPCCNGLRGHPVGFSHYYKEELMALNSDQGAKAIIEKHSQDIVLCNTADRGCLQDIDRQEDIQQRIFNN